MQAGGLAGVCLVWRDGGGELGELVFVSCSFSPSSKLVVSGFQRAAKKTIPGM